MCFWSKNEVYNVSVSFSMAETSCCDRLSGKFDIFQRKVRENALNISVSTLD